MPVIAFDSETELIRPGRTAPRMACMTWQLDDGLGPFPSMIIHAGDHRAREQFRGWLMEPGIVWLVLRCSEQKS